MAFTGPETTSFFEDNGQMGLSHHTQAFLQEEGIISMEDLAKFDTKDSWNQISKNCKQKPLVAGPGFYSKDPIFALRKKHL